MYYEWHVTSVRLIEQADKGKIKLCGSELLLAEVLAFPDLDESTAEALLTDMKNLPIDLLPVNEDVLIEAARLRRDYRIKLADAIHVCQQ